MFFFNNRPFEHTKGYYPLFRTESRVVCLLGDLCLFSQCVFQRQCVFTINPFYSESLKRVCVGSTLRPVRPVWVPPTGWLTVWPLPLPLPLPSRCRPHRYLPYRAVAAQLAEALKDIDGDPSQAFPGGAVLSLPHPPTSRGPPEPLLLFFPPQLCLTKPSGGVGGG